LELLGDINLQRATIELRAIDCVLCGLGSLGRSHLNKAEAFGAAAVAVHDQVNRRDLSVLLKQSLHAFGRGAVGQIAHVQFCRAHSSSMCGAVTVANERAKLQTGLDGDKYSTSTSPEEDSCRCPAAV
jgi:hypothetical protein